MKEMELYGTAFQGLKIRSRCLDYVMPQEHCSAHVKDTLSTLVVEQKNEDGKTRPVYRAAPGKLSQVLTEMTINLSLRRLLSHKIACKSGLTMWHLHYARTSDSP